MVTSATSEKGNTVSVSVNIKDNAGLWGLKFKVGYDHSILNLISAENGDVFEDKDVMLPGSIDKEDFVYLASLSSIQNNTADGTIVNLKFSVSDKAELKPYPITLNIEQAINTDGGDVHITAREGAVSVVKCIHAFNPDWDSNVNYHWHNCAIKGCGEKLENTVSPHHATEIPAVKATCSNDGLTKGTKCSVCGYIMEKQQTVPAAGHIPTVIPAVTATTKKTGLTAGTKCTICEKILTPQQIVPKISYKMKISAKTNGKTKMYEKRKTSSNIIKTIKQKTKVKIVDMKGRWYKVKYKGKMGFVKSASLTWQGTIKTKSEKIRLRSGTGKKSKILDLYPDGTAVTIVASTYGWYKVKVKKGKKTLAGYLPQKYIAK
ncbi:MAG: SH3 domain-containing protein [Lachnospiraceae bacterium]|nr:SH3 domain-containing protein [Lachnospiraceae bacterium]